MFQSISKAYDDFIYNYTNYAINQYLDEVI